MSEYASVSTCRWISDLISPALRPGSYCEYNQLRHQCPYPEYHGKLRLEFAHHVTLIKSRERELTINNATTRGAQRSHVEPNVESAVRYVSNLGHTKDILFVGLGQQL